KVCVALVPAAALGAGGLSVADHVAAVRTHRAPSQSARHNAARRTPAVGPATHDVGRETGKYGPLFSQHPVLAPQEQHRATARRETPAPQTALQPENAAAAPSPARPQSTPQPAVAARSTAAATPAPTPNATPAPTSATTNIVGLQSDQREELDREDQS